MIRLTGPALVRALRACPTGAGAWTPMPADPNVEACGSWPPAMTICPFCRRPFTDQGTHDGAR